jgi:hypothetical protein
VCVCVCVCEYTVIFVLLKQISPVPTYHDMKVYRRHGGKSVHF